MNKGPQRNFPQTLYVVGTVDGSMFIGHESLTEVSDTAKEAGNELAMYRLVDTAKVVTQIDWNTKAGDEPT